MAARSKIVTEIRRAISAKIEPDFKNAFWVRKDDKTLAWVGPLDHSRRVFEALKGVLLRAEYTIACDGKSGTEGEFIIKVIGRTAEWVQEQPKPKIKLKVYGMSYHYPPHRSARAVVATTSMASAAKLFGTSLHHVREFAAVTGNKEECAIAMARPAQAVIVWNGKTIGTLPAVQERELERLKARAEKVGKAVKKASDPAAEEHEIPEVFGSIVTQYECNACDEINWPEGDCDGDVLTCTACGAKNKIRRI